MKTKQYDITYVCFLDILGFKDLVNNNTPKNLTKIYQHLLQNTVDKSVKIWTENGMRDFGVESEIYSVVVSDSIILWTEDIGITSFIKMIMTVQGLLFQTMYYGIPLRGGLSVGSLTVLNSENNTTVFGKGLVSAYTLESQQDWSGCVIDDECINGFKIITKGRSKKGEKKLKIDDIHVLLQYPAPMKSGKIITRWVFDWTKIMTPTDEGFEGKYIQPEGVVNAFEWHKKNSDNWRVQSLIRNTLDFWNYIMDIE